MGSRISSNDMDDQSIGTENTNTYPTNDDTTKNNLNINEQKLPCNSAESHVNIKDKFRLEFLDCDCNCDTTKKIAECDFQGSNILQDIYEMVSEPEI